MNYLKYTLTTNNPDLPEILMAFLADQPFDTFEETPEGLLAYLPSNADVVHVENTLAELQQTFAFSWSKDLIVAQNWNQLWESNFQPVIVGDFVGIRADFHEPLSGVRHELIINPKMAFGTGHHETTFMCLAALEHLPVHGASLLDFGCGTGVLALMASRLGAASITAIDIEEESRSNTVENALRNNIHNITAQCGILSDVEGSEFDGILANINRHVILEGLPKLGKMVRPQGWLLISGILDDDDTIVSGAAAVAGFEKTGQQQRGRWLCQQYLRTS